MKWKRIGALDGKEKYVSVYLPFRTVVVDSEFSVILVFVVLY